MKGGGAARRRAVWRSDKVMRKKFRRPGKIVGKIFRPAPSPRPGLAQCG
jgi:hypothetical protein